MIKEKKALKSLKDILSEATMSENSVCYVTGEDKETLETAIKALERDTPMKVNIEEWIYTQCPSGCGYELSTHHGDGYYSIDKKPTFCPKCGQRLDWGCDND